MGSLSQHVGPEFSSTSRRRGEHYARQGAVTLTGRSVGDILAVVSGTFDYTVTVRRSADELRVSCTCPRYLDQFVPCKHIWASLLVAETEGLLPPAKTHASIDLILDHEGLDDLDDDFEDDHDFVTLPQSQRLRSQFGQSRRSVRRQDHSSPWTTIRDAVRQDLAAKRTTWSRPDLAFSELHFLVDIEASRAATRLVIELACRTRRTNGDWGKIKAVSLAESDLRHLSEPDRALLLQLNGASAPASYGHYYASGAAPRYSQFVQLPGVFRVPPELHERVLPLLDQTGRGHIRLPGDYRNENLVPLVWDDGPGWHFGLEVRAASQTDSTKGLIVTGSFRDGRPGNTDARLDAGTPDLIVPGGLILNGGTAARVDADDVFPWIVQLRRQDPITIPRGQEEELLGLLARTNARRVELPADFQFERVRSVPTPRLLLRTTAYRGDAMSADLEFLYEDQTIPHDAPDTDVWLPGERRLVERDLSVEKNALGRLRGLGIKQLAGHSGDFAVNLTPTRLERVVAELLTEGWQVAVDGTPYREASGWQMDVRSGIDWFELHGHADFGDVSAPLPALLEALAVGSGTVRLSDGAIGVLPVGWLTAYGALASLGRADGDSVRFERHHVGLLDALIAAEPAATCDEMFQRAREELCSFQGVAPLAAPPTFVGDLREYQQEGLGWFDFLRRFGFGGCLADEMGLGKTVMVLALLDTRREHPGDDDAAPRPSLVVVPRSLISNWIEEAGRFTPELRVLDYTGAGRRGRLDPLSDHDVVLTTYGTLRRDAATLRELDFDYVVLDEAQAIKNARTASAKAARLLRARYRLALSGTPIENHLGELWSLFEFLNPGLLGTATVFKRLGASTNGVDDDTRPLLAKTVRPFVLRRTKNEVARDLPAKHEQTVYCDLDVKQRKLYNELRDHYRRALLPKIDDQGLARSKILVLEALLRLRQTACHPALLDSKRESESSAKLEVLLARLAELRADGQKVLVFSQFTRFLSIVRRQLDDLGVDYAYLDGRTRDRARRVETFQSDPDVGLFLISLKAGGLGLNLTAAEYVFLLDPWWNPAVEAQAIDRAHRIGQTRPVFAYRLIARDTVEEKILELQKTKRDLADAILTETNSVIRTLRREDLEHLLS